MRGSSTVEPDKYSTGAGEGTRTLDINLGKTPKNNNREANSGSKNVECQPTPGDIFNPHRAFYGTWIPQWLDERSEVSERAKKLYAYLTYFAGGKGRAWPSYATLAEKLHVTRRHVIRILCELSEHQLIKITHVNDPKRGHRANVYEFLWHEWMQNPEDKNFKLVVPEESPPEEVSDSYEDVFDNSQPSTPAGVKNVTRVVELPPTTPSDISDTRVRQLPPSDPDVTSLVTPMSPRSQENKKKRINKYKHPKGACSSSVLRQTHGLPEPARHSVALVRKAWQVSRKLLNKFWDNCKVRPDLRILFGYVSRALREGYKEESIRDAFERALHQCHGHATDCGELWEASSTVHRAEKWLRKHGLFWQPTPPEERRRIRAEIAAAMKAWEVQS